MRKEIVLILNERKVYSQICMKPALGLLFDFLFFVVVVVVAFAGPGEDCKWRPT